MAGSGANHLDGRAASSAGVCRAHLARFFDGQVGRRYVDRHHDALETGWIRRNGIPRSDRATLTEHWVRHGDYLTLISIITDPAYLTEPFIRTTNWMLDPRQQIAPYPCEAVVEVDRPKGSVPHHLPGTNTFLGDFAKRYSLPEAAARGGAETMYPEVEQKMKAGEK